MDEKAIEAAGRAICIAAGYEPEEWADNEVLRDRCIKYARVALNTLSPGSTGSDEGWVLVPREPTLAMCNAGWREIDKQGFQTEDTEVAPIYRAMLSAAGGK